jgi:hypothetical protein
MEKALITLTARVVRAHREMAPCIARIHTGFMVETNLQTLEKDLQQLQEMLRQVREAQKAPPTRTQVMISIRTNTLLQSKCAHDDA